MKKVIMLAIMLLSTSNFLYAKQCQIENLVATQLNLNASYLSQAATSFSVACDSNYAIKFNTRNLTSASGSSFLINERNNRLRTQMNISGATASRWNAPIFQPATERNKFVVLVQLVDPPSAYTPAGEYRDNLYINLMF
ncbi:hypothetical protein KVY11_13470 [Acinetobacter sp. CWB-G5]|jgi:hypothetical protein|uniref:hypothetical protein n=1 Tax=unclassified Acinetobacter TaxID=196816 RepID=UPI001C45145D|nr:hypothetical protein [Acinetobacter sp. CWB-G5]MBV7309681.1 hypothetical protein [Acinetobacter sp. CWB-G5]